MPHLQQLKIGPNVEEKEKKQDTDVDGKENCSFASPDRKKKRQEAMQKPCPSPLVARNVGGVHAHAQPAAVATKPQQQPAPLGEVRQQLEAKDEEQFDPDSTHLGTVVWVIVRWQSQQQGEGMGEITQIKKLKQFSGVGVEQGRQF